MTAFYNNGTLTSGMTQIEGSSGGWYKLRIYRKFKHSFELEQYMFLIKDPLMRSLHELS